MRSVPLAILVFSLVATGCPAHRTEALGPGEIEIPDLDFLEDGVTTREAVCERLGEPSGRFEGHRILTYRLDENYEVAAARLEVGTTLTGWGLESYSLVLVFADDGVLARHRLIRIR